MPKWLNLEESKNGIVNSVDPNEMAHNELSYCAKHCLAFSFVIALFASSVFNFCLTPPFVTMNSSTFKYGRVCLSYMGERAN